MVCSVMNEQNKEKYSVKISQIIIKWGGLAVSLFSYGLILGLAGAGLGLMTISTLFALLFDSGFFSGFGFLSGAVIFTAGGSLFLWKAIRELENLYQHVKKTETA